MPAPYRKTHARVERMLELHAKGASAREIADELGVGSHATILRWLADAGLKPNGGQGARKVRARADLDVMAQKLLDAQKELAELSKGPPPKTSGEMLERLLRQFHEMQALVLLHMKRAGQGQSTMAELQKAMQIQDWFTTRITELTPAAPPDPSADPANTAAADRTREKLALMVQSAEAEFRCRNCGASPF